MHYHKLPAHNGFHFVAEDLTESLEENQEKSPEL